MSRTWINRLVKQGKLLFGPDKRIDYMDALKQLEGSKDYNRESQREYAKRQRKGKPVGEFLPPILPDGEIYDTDGKLIYGNTDCDNGLIGIETQRSRLVRETLEARLCEIKLAKERKELIPVAEVCKVNEYIAVSIRSKLLALPTRIAPQIEGLKASKIQRKLEEAVNDILTEVNFLGKVQ